MSRSSGYGQKDSMILSYNSSGNWKAILLYRNCSKSEFPLTDFVFLPHSHMPSSDHPMMPSSDHLWYPPLTTLWTQCFGSQSFNMTLSSWHQTSNSLISLLVEYIKIQPGRPTQRWWAIYWFLQATWLLGLNSSGIMSSLNCWCIFW